MEGRVLVVDDEADIRELLGMTLMRMGLAADCAATEFEALQYLQKQAYQLCLTDMRLPDGDGISLLQRVSAEFPDMPVAVITAFGSAENAVAALKAGAFDYLSKPVSLNQLRDLVRSAMKLSAPDITEKTPQAMRPERAVVGEAVLLGDSLRMQETRHMIERLARSQAPIYLTGESGSGKELAARLIHANSARRDEAFVAVNCGAIPENLMESEFFGYRKGAFTGADQERDGFFQAANRGTLFLDEVAELPLLMQVKLLRVIQEKKVRKVGATQEEAIDVRIISATHQNLAEAVQAGTVRQDLYYRLNVIELKMPSLREMAEDIPLLARAILTRQAREHGRATPELAIDAVRLLQRYAFPGNVRELENILERALALSSGDLIAESDLQLAVSTNSTGEGGASTIRYGNMPLQEFLDDVERQAILQALEQTRHNRTAAAKLLGITFRSMRYRMERLGIS